jgi:hypothetical protein
MQALLGNTVPEEYQFWTNPRNRMSNRSDAFQKETSQEQITFARSMTLAVGTKADSQFGLLPC